MVAYLPLIIFDIFNHERSKAVFAELIPCRLKNSCLVGPLRSFSQLAKVTLYFSQHELDATDHFKKTVH